MGHSLLSCSSPLSVGRQMSTWGNFANVNCGNSYIHVALGSGCSKSFHSTTNKGESRGASWLPNFPQPFFLCVKHHDYLERKKEKKPYQASAIHVAAVRVHKEYVNYMPMMSRWLGADLAHTPELARSPRGLLAFTMI